ncbi:hypothetical protein ES705_20944 [subsurface metagenome]
MPYEPAPLVDTAGLQGAAIAGVLSAANANTAIITIGIAIYLVFIFFSFHLLNFYKGIANRQIGK